MLKAIWILIRYFYINDHTSIKLQTVEAIPNSSRSLLLFKCEEVAGSNVGSDMNKTFFWNDVIIDDFIGESLYIVRQKLSEPFAESK